MPDPSPSAAPRPAVVTLAGLFEELLWPHLLRAPVLALRFDRMVLAFIAVALMGVASSIPTIWGAEGVIVAGPGASVMAGEGTSSIEVVSSHAGPVASSWTWLLGLPEAIRRSDTAGLVLFGVIKLLILATIGAGLARSAACEFGAGVMISGPQALAFGLSRWYSGFAAMAVPLGVAAFGGVLLAVLGLLLAVPGLNILGAILYPLLVVIGVVMVVILACLVLGGGMLVPAFAVECTDAIDAIQRVFNYVLHRPLSLVIYLAVAVVTGAVAMTLAFALGGAGVALTDWCAGQWSGATGAAVLGGTAEGGVNAAAAWIVSTVKGVVLVVMYAYLFSYVMCAGTIVYLLVRQRNDAQHWSEIWFASALEGEVAHEAPQVRAADEEEAN
ncbi:MAG: hypothetical protein KIT24_02550 [Phycisphaeraceae bacterium]|nr:hypothetical protein [Phycisphaeraceae bacterium]